MFDIYFYGRHKLCMVWNCVNEYRILIVQDVKTSAELVTTFVTYIRNLWMAFANESHKTQVYVYMSESRIRFYTFLCKQEVGIHNNG